MTTRRLLFTSLVLASTFIATGCSETSELANDTGTVQSTLVQTRDDELIDVPSARVARKCVYEVPNGALIDHRGRVVVDGRVVAHPPRCPITAKRNRNPNNLPTVNGWVEHVNAMTVPGDWYSRLLGTWTVPPNAAWCGFPWNCANNQLIYFFTALEPLTAPAAIIQPVLQFGSGPAGGGFYFSMSSWYIDENDNAFHTSALSTSPGRTISGVLNGSLCESDGSGCTWEISISDGFGSRSIFVEADEIMEWAFKGALEVYNVIRCNQYPGTSITFSNIQLLSTVSGVPDTNVTNTAGWTTWVASGLSPSCGYSAVDLTGGAQLNY